MAAKKRKQVEGEAKHWREEEAVVAGLEGEVQALRVTDPGMTLLNAVEYVTSHPARRIVLYRCCHAEDQSLGAAKDLAFLERRAKAEGFQV